MTHRAGVFAAPEDTEALASAIEWLADHPADRVAMGARGRAWVVANASREVLAAKYLAILENLAKCSTSTTVSAPSIL